MKTIGHGNMPTSTHESGGFIVRNRGLSPVVFSRVVDWRAFSGIYAWKRAPIKDF